jgi:hypothetical protein
MDKTEATHILGQHLQSYRRLSFEELARLVTARHVECITVAAPSGAEYQIEVECQWDLEPGGAIRVLGAVDDGGWRAFVPLTDDFLVPPEPSEADA